MPKLESGTYESADLHIDVEVWPLVKDEEGDLTPNWEDYPDGFDVETDSNGDDYLVLRDGTKRNRLIRDLNGEAIVLAPGGAVVTKSNGVRYTIGPDAVAEFQAAYTKVDAPEPTPAPADPAPVETAPDDPAPADPTPAEPTTPDPTV